MNDAEFRLMIRAISDDDWCEDMSGDDGRDLICEGRRMVRMRECSEYRVDKRDDDDNWTQVYPRT